MFREAHALTKEFKMMPKKKIHTLKENATVQKFEEHLHHGNGYRYLLAERIYTSNNGT